MPTEAAPARRPLTPGRGWVGLVAIVAGCTLVALAAPRLLAAVSTLEARGAAPSLVGLTAPVEAAARKAALRDMTRAADLVPDATLLTDLGLLQARQALDSGTAQDRATAISELRRGLALGPVHPVGWAMLADLLRRDGMTAEAATALRLSMQAGPVVPGLMVGRLDLGLRLLPDLDEDARALLARQVRLTWRLSPEPVLRMLRDPAATGFLVAALAETQD